MAEQLKLVLRDESVDFYGGAGDVSSLDLSSWVAENGWVQSVATDAPTVDEVLTLHVPGTTDDNLAANIQSLDAMLVNAERAQDWKNFKEVWLRSQMVGETGARQAMIKAIRRGKAPVIDPLARTAHYFRDYTLGVERTALWEGTALRTVSGTGISSLGGKLNYTGIVGDRPARVALSRVLDTGDALRDFWFGVQSQRLNATPANFNPVWNLRLTPPGNYGADTTGGVTNADATAQDGYKVVCTFATVPTLLPRVKLTTQYVTNAQPGRYLVLLRALCTSTRVARVRLGAGYNMVTAGGFFNPLPKRTVINSTSWRLYPLGVVDIPVRPNSSIDFSTAGIQIEAESVSGSGNLEMDCGILIPALDGYMHVKSDVGFNTVSRYFEVYHRPDNEISGKVIDVATPASYKPIEELHPDHKNWGLEPGNGTIVCAGQLVSSNKDDTMDLAFYAYERWLTLRGAE